MKITVRNKKRGGLTIAFKAQKGGEGVDLKDILFAEVKKPDGLTPAGMLEQLGAMGYRGDIHESEDKRLLVATVEKGGGCPGALDCLGCSYCEPEAKAAKHARA